MNLDRRILEEVKKHLGEEIERENRQAKFSLAKITYDPRCSDHERESWLKSYVKHCVRAVAFQDILNIIHEITRQELVSEQLEQVPEASEE